MSRKIKRRFDADDLDSVFVPPSPPDHMQGAPLVNFDVPAYKKDKKFNYLISRARYIGSLKNTAHEPRLRQLIASDEMDACENPLEALYIADEVYREYSGTFRETLHRDEDKDNPSDEARTRARILCIYFMRLLEYRKFQSPIFDDLQAILGSWSMPANEKHALAQKLVIENPEMSLGKIAEASEDSKAYPDLNFDQSCLTQWIKAGIVIDTHADTRPKWGLGRR
jgi:hypothetical protein